MQGNADHNVMGQKEIQGGKGSKLHHEFEASRQSGDTGSSPIPKVEGDYCNSPKGQETK